MAKVKFKAAMPPFKRSAVKKLHHPYSRLVLRSLGEGGREKTSSVFICSADYAVTSKRNEMERLHPPSHKATADKQARLLVFCEDVKKRLRLLSEVVPDGTVKRSLAASFAIFLQKKWRRGRDSNPRYGFPYDSLANCCFRPLSHLSALQQF